MKALRSLESTSAPHLIILSTSLDQLCLLKRCCRMMRESGDWANSDVPARQRIAAAQAHGLNRLDEHMNPHLIDGVVEISAGIPGGGLRLRASLIIGSAGHDRVFTCLWSRPNIVPEP